MFYFTCDRCLNSVLQPESSRSNADDSEDDEEEGDVDDEDDVQDDDDDDSEDDSRAAPVMTRGKHVTAGARN